MPDVGKTMRRSKAFSLDLQKDPLERIRLPNIDRQRSLARQLESGAEFPAPYK